MPVKAKTQLCLRASKAEAWSTKRILEKRETEKKGENERKEQ